MDTSKHGGAAFPTSEYHGKGMTCDEATGLYQFSGPHPGMTLRDYFAAQALAGMMAAQPWDELACDRKLAERAYLAADAMLAVRS